MRLEFMAPAAIAALVVFPSAAASQDAQQRYQEACDDGTLASCTILGMMYERGAGVEQDAWRAAALYMTACDGGVLAACTNAGRLYERGVGVGRSLVRAADLYRQACGGGEALACDLLATVERNGANPADGFFKAGRVEDAETGDALPEAVVDVPSLGIRATSDSSGRVELGRLPAGRYGIVVERFGYEPVDGDIDVPGDAEFVVLLPAASVDDPFAPGRIVGQVSAEDGRDGLSGVEIAIGDVSRTLSNAQGAFALANVPPGLHQIRLSYLGYATRTTTVILQPGATVELSARMSSEVIALDPIEVTVRSGSGYLERSGFYRRAQGGWGTHFDAEFIERTSPILISDMLRGRVPGVRIQYERENTYAMSRRGVNIRATGTPVQDMGGACRIPVYVDGVPTFDDELDRINPESVAALEVYHGVGTPIEYDFGCGVVLIWTIR